MHKPNSELLSKGLLFYGPYQQHVIWPYYTVVHVLYIRKYKAHISLYELSFRNVIHNFQFHDFICYRRHSHRQTETKPHHFGLVYAATSDIMMMLLMPL